MPAVEWMLVLLFVSVIVAFVGCALGLAALLVAEQIRSEE